MDVNGRLRLELAVECSLWNSYREIFDCSQAVIADINHSTAESRIGKRPPASALWAK